jgi:hypothetical protein
MATLPAAGPQSVARRLAGLPEHHQAGDTSPCDRWGGEEDTSAHRGLVVEM